MNKIKTLAAVAFAAGVIVAFAVQAVAYPPFVGKARKFGAKDCRFCHVQPDGGPPWNERGQWLIAEKDRRKAEVVDVGWLADFKDGAATPGTTAAVPPAKVEEKNPAEQAAPAADAAKPDPKSYDDYVGDYELPMFVLTISKESDRLYGQPAGESKEELMPAAKDEFDVPNVGARIKFVRDEQGKVIRLIASVNGEQFEGRKVK